MIPHDPHHPETRTVHHSVPQPTGSRPVGVPLYQGHLFSFADAEEMAAAFQEPETTFFYNRYGNPTVRALEEAVAGLEGGTAGLAFASGMGAINGVLLALLKPGDHVIAQRCLFGGTYTVLDDLATRWGVEVTHVSGGDPAEVRAALRPTTRLLYLETIANPTTRVGDLPALISEAAGHGLTTVVDNTFATPLLCRPLDHGADIVIHSATKYLGGHSDVLGGVAVFGSDELRRRVWRYATEQGASADPFAAWLTLRGMQTLALRLERQCANALTLARRLADHPAVTAVHYPGLPGHPDHAIARRLLAGGAGGGVLAFDLAGGRQAGRTVIESVRLASLSPSLGDVKTLVMHPASTSHRQLDADALAAAGIGEGTVRVSVGIEHPDDLWHDLGQALAKVA
ncbi:trans-sulfuration enzyme family protein [Streptomyces sp. 6N223]|uniref:trans-sulfuration enzyme family protein n=1 Tax=Streptomyces sp. 6N223 TaxID=3457412 RepID=UPI003FD04CCD